MPHLLQKVTVPTPDYSFARFRGWISRADHGSIMDIYEMKIILVFLVAATNKESFKEG